MKTKIVKFEKGVDEAVRVLKNGEVIACATDTVYGLSSDPFNKSAVKKIYDLKNRERNIPLLLVAHKDYDVSSLVYLDCRAEKYIEKYWPGSVTFVFRIKDERLKELSCGKDTIAIRKPIDYTFNLLLEKCQILTSTSANISKQPVSTSASDVVKYFGEKISLVLDNGESKNVSSTIIDLTGDKIEILRQGEVKIDNNL